MWKPCGETSHGSWSYRIVKRFPKGSLDQRGHSPGSIWSTSMVFTKKDFNPERETCSRVLTWPKQPIWLAESNISEHSSIVRPYLPESTDIAFDIARNASIYPHEPRAHCNVSVYVGSYRSVEEASISDSYPMSITGSPSRSATVCHWDEHTHSQTARNPQIDQKPCQRF
jgi:hypothetical protein